MELKNPTGGPCPNEVAKSLRGERGHHGGRQCSPLLSDTKTHRPNITKTKDWKTGLGKTKGDRSRMPTTTSGCQLEGLEVEQNIAHKTKSKCDP